MQCCRWNVFWLYSDDINYYFWGTCSFLLGSFLFPLRVAFQPTIEPKPIVTEGKTWTSAAQGARRLGVRSHFAHLPDGWCCETRFFFHNWNHSPSSGRCRLPKSTWWFLFLNMEYGWCSCRQKWNLGWKKNTVPSLVSWKVASWASESTH